MYGKLGKVEAARSAESERSIFDDIDADAEDDEDASRDIG
jgi:hypothetical protein